MPVSPRFSTLPVAIAVVHAPRWPVVSQISMATCRSPVFEPGELGEIVGLHVFDVVAGLLQHLAHDLGGDELAGPVVQRELDRIGRFLRSGGQAEQQRDKAIAPAALSKARAVIEDPLSLKHPCRRSQVLAGTRD